MDAVKDAVLVEQNEAKLPIFVSVGEYRKVPRLDVRQYYYPDATGIPAPTKKGVNLPAADAIALLEALGEIDNRPAGDVVQVDADVRNPVFAKIIENPEGWLLDIRHYFDKDGKWLPTKKGIRIPWTDFENLEEAIRQAAPGFVEGYFAG